LLQIYKKKELISFDPNKIAYVEEKDETGKINKYHLWISFENENRKLPSYIEKRFPGADYRVKSYTKKQIDYDCAIRKLKHMKSQYSVWDFQGDPTVGVLRHLQSSIKTLQATAKSEGEASRVQNHSEVLGNDTISEPPMKKLCQQQQGTLPLNLLNDARGYEQLFEQLANMGWNVIPVVSGMENAKVTMEKQLGEQQQQQEQCTKPEQYPSQCSSDTNILPSTTTTATDKSGSTESQIGIAQQFWNFISALGKK